MFVRWFTPLAALLLFACDKKPEVDPGARTAAVIEKATADAPQPPVAPPEIKPVTAPPPSEAKPPEAKPPEAKPPEAKPPEAKPPEAKPPEPAPEARPVEPMPAPAPVEGGAQALMPDLEVTDAAVTDAIIDRMPSARKAAWKIGEDTKLIGWFEFKNPGAKVELDLVWKKNGTENWRFPTSVGSGKNWRTWAEKRITKKDAGNWTVEAVDANGHVYQSVTYTVE